MNHPCVPGDLIPCALSFFESLRVSGTPVGRYRYAPGMDMPVLYASAYAALARHLLGDLDGLSERERRQWIDYLLSFQCDDGLFRDPAVECPTAETEDWWGWRHMTCHVLMALEALGARAPRPFACIERLKAPGAMAEWLANCDWGERVAFTSNHVQNIGILLQYARDVHGDARAGRAMAEVLDALDARQDPATGLWGKAGDSPEMLSQGVQGTYHFLLLYLYDRRPVRHVERLVDSVLATQNAQGGFAPHPNSSACEDIDSIDPLVRLAPLTDHRADDVRHALTRAVPWVLSNRNADGGFVFRRHAAFTYGHARMHAEADESAAFPTWFRLLSLTLLARALPGRLSDPLGRRFVDAPGYQFWRPARV